MRLHYQIINTSAFLLLAVTCLANPNIISTPLAFSTVGVGADCDYDIGFLTLQNAIDFGENELRIANNVTYDGISITSANKTIIGGYNNCTDAVNNLIGADYSIISGINASNLPVINVNNSDINFSNLLLQNGNVGIKANGGGAVFNLHNLLIQNNNASGANLGGGMMLDNVANAFLEDVIITNNSSGSAAGGVYCNSGKFTMVGESSIDNNIALGNAGGGIYAIDCDITLVGGSNLNPSSGIVNNQSQLNGGGIYFTSSNASSPSTLVITGGLQVVNAVSYGDLNTSFKISGNASSSEGGGIYAKRSQVILTNIESFNNLSLLLGGFIRLQDSSYLSIGRSSQACWSNTGCNAIYQNNASAGGVFHITDSSVNINSSIIAGNRANAGTVLIATGQNASTVIDITSSFIFKNGALGTGTYNDDTLMLFANNAKFNLLHSTIVDNATINSGIKLDDSGTSTLTNSIIYSADIGPYINVIGTSVVTSDCLIVDDTNNTSSGSITAISPSQYADTFLSPATFDYHLKQNSIAIDHCTESALPAVFDIDGDVFGYDQPGVNGTGSTTYDVGADEYVFFIFTDGFE